MVAIAKKTSSSSAKTAATKRASPTHPSWHDMIVECIAAHPEDARYGVSRQQIKKFVEESYRIEFGNAQTTQLGKAITKGEEKGEFVLPKGPSGRVKLSLKAKPAESKDKENKPAKKARMTARGVAMKKASAAKKPAASKATSTKTSAKPMTKAAPKVKPAAERSKPAASKSTGKEKAATVKAKPAVKPAPKKTYAGKARASPTKKTTSPSKRGSAKKAVTGNTSVTKAKAAATKSSKVQASPKKKAAGKATPAKSTTTARERKSSVAKK